MQIHELKVKPKKERKTIGRGGKRGTYSGRGNKGQKARSGGNVNPLFEGGRSSLVERMKKLRGFKSAHPKKTIVDLSVLENKFSSGETVDVAVLIERGIISASEAKNGVKILGNGTLAKKINIDKNILVSGAARAAIEKAGGKMG